MGVILHGVCYDTHMMTTALLVALLLGQTITPVKVTDPTQPSSAVTTTPVATKRGLDVNVIGGGAGGGAVTQATTPWITQDNHTTAVAPLACRLTDGASFYTAGGSTGLTDAQLRATPVPVSGTFWQTTQPVSWAGQSVAVSSLPGSPAQEHTAANSPNACRLSDGTNFLSSLPVTGTFWQATQPVSGTFWQATQPVSAVALPLPTGAATEATLAAMSAKLPAALGPQTSATSLSTTPATGASWPVTGTFWQTTQPVSIASMPSTPVTGTFWQATQPVSSTQLPAALGPQASAASFSVTPATGATFPVSGTFWQTTQPVSGSVTVSGTVTANAGTGTMAVSGPLTDTQLRATAVPVSGTFWQATQPISGTVTVTDGAGALNVIVDSSALPSGAATETTLSTRASETTLSTLNGKIPSNLTVTSTRLLVDGSGVTQPVSGTVTATVASTTVTNTVATKVSKVAAAPLATAVTVTGSATALPASVLTNRVSLCVYNNGASTMYLGPAGVTTASGLPLPAGGSFCDDVGSQVYYAIVTSGSVEARVLEN